MGKGQSFFRETIRRDPIVSPETSPATMKTLSSPSLEAISTAAWLETEKELLDNRNNPASTQGLKFRLVLHNIGQNSLSNISTSKEVVQTKCRPQTDICISYTRKTRERLE